jgi:hypothetical protein
VSEPKRYGIDPKYCSIEEFEDGQYVSYEDYARLKTEVERLTEAWVDKKMQEDRDALLQQVERLTKERDKALTDFWCIHEGYFRLQAELNRLTAFTTRTIIPNEELQAQVERLTKAGDAMLPLLGRGDWHIARNDWNAAKRGKQP